MPDLRLIADIVAALGLSVARKKELENGSRLTTSEWNALSNDLKSEVRTLSPDLIPISTPTPSTIVMKVYTPFTSDDIVQNLSRRVTTGMWTGNTGSLTTFFTSSAQSGSSGDWYYDVYQSNPDVTGSAEIQFSVAYGHRTNGGCPTIAVTNTSKEVTKAIYTQYRNILLDPEDDKFTFANSWSTDHIFVINIRRARLKQKIDNGNWQLTLTTGSYTIKLIDDSADKFDQNTSQAGRIYNVVSGSLNVGSTATTYLAATSEPSGGYGLFYPDRGLIILNPDALMAHLKSVTNVYSFLVNTGSTAALGNIDNKGFLLNMIKSGSSFIARNEEVITSTNYFVRVKNKEYNFSNNPTFYTSSDGSLKISSFVGDPQVYISTIGLYNDSNELCAVAKVSRPILKNFEREALIKIRLDY